MTYEKDPLRNKNRDTLPNDRTLENDSSGINQEPISLLEKQRRQETLKELKKTYARRKRQQWFFISFLLVALIIAIVNIIVMLTS